MHEDGGGRLGGGTMKGGKRETGYNLHSLKKRHYQPRYKHYTSEKLEKQWRGPIIIHRKGPIRTGRAKPEFFSGELQQQGTVSSDSDRVSHARIYDGMKLKEGMVMPADTRTKRGET